MSAITPRIDSIRFYTGKPRKKPETGDRRVIRGVEHVRIQARCESGLLVQNGRPVWEWVPIDQVEFIGRWPQRKRDIKQQPSAEGDV